MLRRYFSMAVFQKVAMRFSYLILSLFQQKNRSSDTYHQHFSSNILFLEKKTALLNNCRKNSGIFLE